MHSLQALAGVGRRGEWLDAKVRTRPALAAGKAGLVVAGIFVNDSAVHSL